jgi:phosphoribosylformylglycinamidine synthase
MTTHPPRAIVLRAAGTNCDAEMVRAFELAGARARLVHVDRAIAEPGLLEEADLLGFPGGFSYGDDIASGRVFAVKLRERLWPALRAAAERGCPMIGACNGFQVLVQVGLLPGPEGSEHWPDRAPAQRVALAENQHARFVDRWVRVEADADSRCVWTRPLVDAGFGADAMMLPIAHGEGRFVADSADTIRALERSGQVALRYAKADNINGSEGRIAGICDPSGRIFGLMPHPERYTQWTHHPFWTRLEPDARRGDTPGLAMFRAAVSACREPVGA